MALMFELEIRLSLFVSSTVGKCSGLLKAPDGKQKIRDIRENRKYITWNFPYAVWYALECKITKAKVLEPLSFTLPF